MPLARSFAALRRILRIVMIDLSVVPRCSCERSQILPGDSVTMRSWLPKSETPEKNGLSA